MAKSVVVVGGGIGGIATAGLMARDGYDVTLVEAHSRLGGRAGLWEKDGFRFDTGPSWYLMPEVFDHWYRLMGSSAAEHLKLTKLDPGYRVYFEPSSSEPAEFVDIRATREDNLALLEEMEPGSRASMEKYLDSAEETYEIAKKHFLYTSFQDLRPLLVKEVLSRTGTLVRLLTTPIMTFAKKYTANPRIRQILGYPAVFLGSSPYIAPSMFHLMSHLDLQDGVLYAEGGFTRVIDSMREIIEDHGVTIMTGTKATAIATERSGGKAKATGITYKDADGHTHTLSADMVVSTTDLHHSETTLLPPELQTYPQKWWDKKVAGPSAVLLYLGVKGEVPELLHHSLFFTQDWDSNFSQIFADKPTVPSPASLYVCKPSATDSSVAPRGHTNLFVLVPMPADVGLGHGGLDGTGDPQVEGIADRAIEQIMRWSGATDLADRIVVRRSVGPADFAGELNAWKGTALGPAHTLMQSALFRAGNVSKKVDRLYYAGSSTIPGIGLPMCLISAEVLLKRVRGDVSTGPLPEPLVPVS
ncbi:phytoene desaturase family protein [Pontimonas sp.]|nr:phytoene desaturase family protein [Pontimonas sp.]